MARPYLRESGLAAEGREALPTPKSVAAAPFLPNLNTGKDIPCH